MLLSRSGSGVWRPLAISTGSQARPWRGGETPGRSGGLDRTLELSIRGVIPDQNGWNFEKAYIIWKIISNAFPFQSLKNVQESLKNTKNLLYNFFWLKTCSNKHILSFGCNTWIIINPDEDIIIYWLDTLEERTCNSNWCQLGFVKDATEVTVGNWKAIDSNCETDTTVNTATASLSLLMPNWLTVPSDRSQL